ncbi:MAG: ATP-binding protein, partial [Candidatus Aminicenantes bacterium]|nr:ATP-binding protein [Candidatus Aminicenantes bacterium]
YLEEFIIEDMKQKIVILSGPRQVGKTTLSKQLIPSFCYLNFDSSSDRNLIRKQEWDRDVELVVFDELHKMKKWKSWIKGLYDTEGIPPSLLVTGSARIETARKGGDSLAGRFFSYRLHPLTVKEIFHCLKEDPKEALNKLIDIGGFPEPYLKGNKSYAKRWRRTHIDTIVRQDLIDLSFVRDVRSIEILIDLLKTRVGSSTSYSALAEDLQVSIHTVKHWLQILENLYIVFPVRPYHKNIARSILKSPKYYFYDTGAIEGSMGSKLENVVALALLRELHFLEDTTGSKVSLHYLKDKSNHEVDFLAVIDNKPALMAEVKVSDDSFSKSLFRFRSYLEETKSVQVVYNLTRKKSSRGVRMLPAHEFLAELDLIQTKKIRN